MHCQAMSGKFQRDNHTRSGQSQRRVQHVGGKPAHAASHLRKRSCVICSCCAAEVNNSLAASLPSRCSRICNISAGCLPVAQTIKILPKRASYARCPSCMRLRIAASASSIWLCSPFDHAAESAVVAVGACFSPMRGWLLNASRQSLSGRPRQQSEAAAKRLASSAKGRCAAICAAHFRDPQQESTSCEASTSGKLFHRASTAFIAIRQTPATDFPQPAGGKQRSSGCRLWALPHPPWHVSPLQQRPESESCLIEP